ncbi:hypothetical protein DAI22_04g113400 [Oryza sativa Japonica Group]|nr:hypothetical protein DAI22_04g113400 [Oryza sativa Japonica Group]
MGILVISADLKCCRCKEKLSKILCSLRDKYGIEKTEYEDKDDRVIVRGNFPTDKLRSVIWCKAGRKLIRDIAVVDVWPPPKKPETAGGTTPAPAVANPPPAATVAATPPKVDGAGNKGEKQPKTTTPPPPPPPVPLPYPWPPCYYPPMQHCQTSSTTWTGSCPTQCHCCPKSPPPETKTKACEYCSRDHCHGGCKITPPPPPPSRCGGCDHADCGGWCGGQPPINCPPPPPPSRCGGCGHGDCGGWCGGHRPPINCPAPPPPCCQQQPWGGGCQYDENACSVM